MKNASMITCASAGLGMEFASQIAAQGIDVVLVARREARLHELAAQPREAHDVRSKQLALERWKRPVKQPRG